MRLRRIILFITAMGILLSAGKAYDQQTGFIQPGETSLASTSFKIEDSKLGSIQGTAINTDYSLTNGLLGSSNVPNVIFTIRTVEVIAPTSNGYSGSVHDIVPGAKLKYFIGLKNDSDVPATNYYIRDIVPQHTHLYYDYEPPSLNGQATSINYLGATSNAAAGTEVKFKFDLPAQGTTTFSFTVTID